MRQEGAHSGGAAELHPVIGDAIRRPSPILLRSPLRLPHVPRPPFLTDNIVSDAFSPYSAIRSTVVRQHVHAESRHLHIRRLRLGLPDGESPVAPNRSSEE